MSSKEKTEVTEIWEGPGAILRRAREAKGLDVPAVAGMLHLSEKKLQALEADDFAQLPEPVYVRGYLKNYARFLDEPAEPILNAYARLSPVTMSEKQPLLDSHVVEDFGGSGHDMVRIVSILVVVVVVLAPVIWWWDSLGLAVEKIVGKAVQYNEQGGATPDTANRQSGLSEFIQNPSQVSADTETRTDTGAGAELPAAQDGGAQLTETIKPLPRLEQVETATPALKEQSVTSDDSTVIQPLPKPEVVQPPPESESAVANTSAPESKPVPEPTAAHKETVFEFIASSWVKVRDNNDQVVLIGEYKKGETKKLLGIHAPYKVVLGDANAVRVKIDGKTMNLDQFSSGGVSRFTIKDGQIENP